MPCCCVEYKVLGPRGYRISPRPEASRHVIYVFSLLIVVIAKQIWMSRGERVENTHSHHEKQISLVSCFPFPFLRYFPNSPMALVRVTTLFTDVVLAHSISVHRELDI